MKRFMYIAPIIAFLVTLFLFTDYLDSYGSSPIATLMFVVIPFLLMGVMIGIGYLIGLHQKQQNEKESNQ